MVLIVNGEPFESCAASVADLLKEREHDGEHGGEHMAVAVNHEVVPRARWAATPLAEGDAVEIITPRQGG